MASIILSSVGTSVGNMFMPGLGGRLLSAAGRKVGTVVDQEIGWSSSSSSSEPERLENFKVQDSSYGVAIPLTFGQMRVSGNVIWASDLIETEHESHVNGGKGGTISSVFGTTTTSYTYSLNCAIALGEGEIGAIQTIWADSKVIYQDGAWADGILASATVHSGALDQPVDPLLESWIGSGLTPAYRGVAYIVLEGLELSNFGNRLPNMTFEILPRETNGDPAWQGFVNPEIYHTVVTNRQGGMAPLVLEGGSVTAQKMLVGGYLGDGMNGQVVAVTYDVTDSVPVEVGRVCSGSFVCEDVGDHCWAVSPGGRFVAVGIQDGSSGYPYHVMLYDTYNEVFGEVLSISMLNMELRQIAWIDAQHFIVNDYRDTARGVRVFMRSGTNVVDCGFYDVWGNGTYASRVPVGYTQFLRFGDGVLTFMGDRALNFTTMYGRYLTWGDTKLEVGDAFTLSSGYNVGSGSGPQVTLHKTGDEEWTLFYLTLIDMQMMSFVPTQTGVTVTRPWQKFTSDVFTASASNVPVVLGNKVFVLHRPSTESVYRISTFLLDDGCFTRLVDAQRVSDVTSSSSYFNAVPLSASRLLVTGNVGFAGLLGQVGAIKLYDTGDTLANVVGKLLGRAGYDDADYDLTALQGVNVAGYCVTKQSSAATAIEQLMLLAPFDLVETDGILRAVVHGAGTEVELDAADAAAGDDAGRAVPLLATSRTQELDLPLELGVDYLDASRDYEIGSQRARRYAVQGAVSRMTLDLPIVTTANTAKQIAKRHLYALWIERDSYRLMVSRRYIGIEPSDIVVVEDIRLRVTHVMFQDGMIQIDGVAAVPADLHADSVADAGAASSASVAASIASSLYLMDLPMLRNEDNQAGFYAAVSALEGWKGATLWRSSDGVDFTRQTTFKTAVTAGVASSVLAASSSLYIDRASCVRVQLLRGTLSSCSQAEMLNGANAVLLGNEILQFMKAELLGPNLYELSGLLRGRKGTEAKISNHALGERFVLLSSSAWQFMPLAMTDRAVGYHFRAVSSGGSLDYARDVTFASSFETLAPYAPAHVRGQRLSGIGSDITIRWVRRARLNAQWVDYIDVPLDEDQELYDLEILKDGAVVRSCTELEESSFIYSAAAQFEDWGAEVPEILQVRLYQRSAVYGRGAVAEATLFS